MAERPDRPSAAALLLTSERGFTLTEVVISILLTGIIVTGTFSGILMTKKTPELSINRVAASMAERQVVEALKSYQTAALDPGAGPNGGQWTFPGDTCNACSGSNCGCALPSCAAGCYALQTGCTHDVSSLLPASLSQSPLDGKMCYTVTDLGPGGPTGQADFQPQVQVFTQWSELQP